MTSVVYRGELMHARTHPVRHGFRYPLYFYGFELADLPVLDRTLPLFGYNRWRPVALHDRRLPRAGKRADSRKSSRACSPPRAAPPPRARRS